MQFLLYLIIGGFSAVINILVFSCLFPTIVADMPTTIAISFCIAAVVNYALCVKLLFNNVKWNSLHRLLSYIFVIVVMGCVDMFLTMATNYQGLSPIAAKSLAALFGVLGNFYLRKYLVFTEKN